MLMLKTDTVVWYFKQSGNVMQCNAILYNAILFSAVTLFRVCQETNHEIARIERKKVEKGREIEELKKQILFCKNSMEIKIMSEKILDKKVGFMFFMYDMWNVNWMTHK